MLDAQEAAARRKINIYVLDFQDGWIEEGDRTKKETNPRPKPFSISISNFPILILPTYPSASSASCTVAYDLINVPTCVISISAFTFLFIPATAKSRRVRCAAT